MKTEWDRAGGGAQANKEGVEDLIPTNRWLKRVVLPGRVEHMRMPLGTGTRPGTGHKEGARKPIRLYVQIKDQEDIAMLIIPPKLTSMMKQRLVTVPPRVVSLFANKLCEFCVQMEYFKGHKVLGRDSEYFCSRHKIVPANLVVFRL
ncbi:Protein transport protein Sec31A [Hordeum vulgare]|nr:Protein transport protein Sec31A [Hordeum vulgare]